MACERAVLRVCLSEVSALPAEEKGRAILANLSLPLPVPTRLWKRFALCEALLFLWCAHGGAHCKTACARPKGKTKAIHWRGAFGEWTPSGKAKAISLARPPEGPSPMAEPMDRSRSACKPFRSARPRARTQGGAVAKHSAKRFQRRAGHRSGGER